MLVGKAVNLQMLVALSLAFVVRGAYLIDFSRVFHHNLANVKREENNFARKLLLLRYSHIIQVFRIYLEKKGIGRTYIYEKIQTKTELKTDTDRCHPTQPFRCPGERTVCISIQYLCDGASDCEDGYDEDPRLCTAAKRPPVEETANFLHTLIMNHGPNYLEKLFGSKARDALEPLGGMQKVAIALSESETLEDFGKALHLMRSDLEHLRNVFMAVETGDFSLLKSLGIRDSELGDVKFFLDKLVSTGFMD